MRGGKRECCLGGVFSSTDGNGSSRIMMRVLMDYNA